MKLSLASSLVALLGFLLINIAPVYGAAAAPAGGPDKARPIPFHGKLKAVDTSAQDITIEGKKADRMFYLTPETKITDGAGAASTLSAATVGVDVGGSYTKDTAGKMTLKSVRFGAKAGMKEKATTAAAAPVATPAPIAAAPQKATPAPTMTAAAAESKARKQMASGKVVSVDATANTIVVHGKADQTFTLAPDAKVTGAANLSAITAGEHVKITYTKSADGATLTASSVTVGK